MSASDDDQILNIEQAASLLGVSPKTFNKVLHAEDIPARKIGREWKFSRQALIDWVGRGRSADYYPGSRLQDGAGSNGGDGAAPPHTDQSSEFPHAAAPGATSEGSHQ